MKESEKDNINLYYVPYVYFDEFPGFSEKFPNGIRVKNVQNNGLEFLNFEIDKIYKPLELNGAINKFFYLTQKSKTVDQMWLRVLREENNNEKPEQISLVFHPNYKPFLPKASDLLTKKGLYFNLRIANILKYGELVRSGIVVNQRQLSFKSTFRIPFEDSSMKLSIVQDRIFGEKALPLKRIELSYKDLLKESQQVTKALEYRLGNYQREKQFTIENGVGLGAQYQTKQILKDLISDSSIGIFGKLWTNSLSSDISVKYNEKINLNLYHLWKRLLVCTQTFSGEYNFGSQAYSYFMPGYKSFDKKNWRYYFTSDSKVMFISSKNLMQAKIFPYLSSTMGVFQDQQGKRNFKASFGVGLLYKFNQSQNITATYNLLHYHQANDKPLKFEINIID